jgi:hypothetical protein
VSALTEAFFGSPNELPQPLPSGMAALVNRLVERLDPAGCRTLLPARVGGATRWYGISSPGLQTRLLLEDLRSWLGSPVAPAATVVMVAADALDAEALKVLPGFTVTRIDVPDDWRSRATQNVTKLLDTWDLAPERSTDVPRPVGRVLRHFYDALLARDRRSAERALQEVQDRSLLSSTNVRFLRVELLASLGTAIELRDDPTLSDITMLARPASVTNHLAVAADQLIVAPAFAAVAPDIAAVAIALEDQWPGLVTHPSQILSASGARCLALVEVAASAPRSSVLTALRTVWGDDPVVAAVLGDGAPMLTRELEAGAEALPAHPITVANPLQLLAEGEYVLAIEAVEAADPDAALVTVAMQAALNLGDAKADARALQLFDRLDEASRERLLGAAVERFFHEQLVARNGSEPVPDGWVEWLEGVGSDRPDLLKSWSAHWGDPGELDSAAADAIAVGLIDALQGERRARTRNGLPVLLDWILGIGDLQPATVPLAVNAVDVLLGSEPGPVERLAAQELLDALLQQGCSADEYREVVGSVSKHLSDLGPRDAGWVAGCLDLLWLSTSPDQSTRNAVTAASLARVQGWGNRVDPLEHALLVRVFEEAGLALEALPPDLADFDMAQREDRPVQRVGIYSLHEASSRIAAGWIRDEWPGVTITESHDHGNSERLEALVRGCDVVLVQVSRATHAATDAISAVGADPSKVVYVNGRGATSIMRELTSWVRGDPS